MIRPRPNWRQFEDRQRRGLRDTDRPAAFSLRFRVLFWAALIRLLRRFTLARRKHSSRWRVLGDAEAAIKAGRPRKAQRLLTPFLAQNPDDVDGWVLLGASRGEDHAAIIQDLQPVQHFARQAPVLAMMLAIAHARVGNQETALEWAQAAGRDPHVRTLLRGQPGFE